MNCWMFSMCKPFTALEMTGWKNSTLKSLPNIFSNIVCFVLFSSVAPLVKISDAILTIVEGSNVTLSCNASGKPSPIITWTQVGDSKVFPQGSSITVLNVSRPGTPDNIIRYQCTASNGVESPVEAVAKVSVHCKYNKKNSMFANMKFVFCKNVANASDTQFQVLFSSESCSSVSVLIQPSSTYWIAYLRGWHNLENILNFSSHLKKSLKSVEVLEN